MFFDAFKKVIDFVSGIVAIFKDNAVKDFSRWIAVAMPLVTGFQSILAGIKEAPVALKDKAVIEECAKYFDSKFVFPGKLEDIDEDLAEVALKIVRIVMIVLGKEQA